MLVLAVEPEFPALEPLCALVGKLVGCAV